METKERELIDNPYDHQLNPITMWKVEYENFWCSRSSTETIKRKDKVKKYLNR